MGWLALGFGVLAAACVGWATIAVYAGAEEDDRAPLGLCEAFWLYAAAALVFGVLSSAALKYSAPEAVSPFAIPEKKAAP